jgi:hypothetical protein
VRAIRHRRFAILLALAASLLGPPIRAGERTNLSMPDSLRADAQHLLRLNGSAVYRKFGFKVLVAGLYLPRPEGDAAKILAADEPRGYVSRFLRSVGSKRVCDAWRTGLASNSPNASAKVRAQFETLGGWTHDFRAGNEIAVTYVPGRGSVVVIDGARKGVLEGKAFADAYFALALGPNPSLGAAFKRRLLGPEAIRASAESPARYRSP